MFRFETSVPLETEISSAAEAAVAKTRDARVAPIRVSSRILNTFSSELRNDPFTRAPALVRSGGFPRDVFKKMTDRIREVTRGS
jgi:hypothetical protein